ncbi:MAG: pyridoxal phosphate-dependent aminotransferase [Spirochaetia bacterium]|jgi:aspartate/methionine/tyrosine aminotransferase|nr:pyridoxal phosphate-dependent aminotransferase [Spirochaetia bacterium]
MILSQRMEAVQFPVIPVVGKLISDNPGTISLGQGVVYYGPPQQALNRVSQFLNSPRNKYESVEGTTELRQAIGKKAVLENGIRTENGSSVFITAGSNMGFMNTVYAITDPGDEIIILKPYYFNHEMAIRMANVKPVAVETDDKYQPDIKAIKQAITPRTRAIVTISPNNPTGAVYDESTLRKVNRLCLDRGIYHISDEAYEYFTYADTKHFSPGSIEGSSDHTISLFSLSKAYGFASWRIGYMIIPERLLSAVQKAQDTILICPPLVTQEAALGALKVGASYCSPFIKEMAEVRQLMLNELDKISNLCTVPASKGAFYFFLHLDTSMDAMDLVTKLIKDYGVAAIPGNAFGMDKGCYLRISYGTLEKETVALGIGRLVKGIKDILGEQV